MTEDFSRVVCSFCVMNDHRENMFCNSIVEDSQVCSFGSFVIFLRISCFVFV